MPDDEDQADPFRAQLVKQLKEFMFKADLDTITTRQAWHRNCAPKLTAVHRSDWSWRRTLECHSSRTAASLTSRPGCSVQWRRR